MRMRDSGGVSESEAHLGWAMLRGVIAGAHAKTPVKLAQQGPSVLVPVDTALEPCRTEAAPLGTLYSV
jgi:hypothetical protein